MRIKKARGSKTQLMKEADNGSVYRKAFRKMLDGEGVCSMCPPNRGCNYKKLVRNFKSMDYCNKN